MRGLIEFLSFAISLPKELIPSFKGAGAPLVLAPVIALLAPVNGPRISRMLVFTADAAEAVAAISSLLDDDGGGGARVGLPRFISAVR